MEFIIIMAQFTYHIQVSLNQTFHLQINVCIYYKIVMTLYNNKYVCYNKLVTIIYVNIFNKPFPVIVVQINQYLNFVLFFPYPFFIEIYYKLFLKI